MRREGANPKRICVPRQTRLGESDKQQVLIEAYARSLPLSTQFRTMLKCTFLIHDLWSHGELVLPPYRLAKYESKSPAGRALSARMILSSHSDTLFIILTRDPGHGAEMARLERCRAARGPARTALTHGRMSPLPCLLPNSSVFQLALAATGHETRLKMTLHQSKTTWGRIHLHMSHTTANYDEEYKEKH